MERSVVDAAINAKEAELSEHKGLYFKTLSRGMRGSYYSKENAILDTLTISVGAHTFYKENDEFYCKEYDRRTLEDIYLILKGHRDDLDLSTPISMVEVFRTLCELLREGKVGMFVCHNINKRVWMLNWMHNDHYANFHRLDKDEYGMTDADVKGYLTSKYETKVAAS